MIALNPAMRTRRRFRNAITDERSRQTHSLVCLGTLARSSALCAASPRPTATPSPFSGPDYSIQAIRYGTVKDFPVAALVMGAPKDERTDIAMVIWLIRGRGRNILFDSGFHREKLVQAISDHRLPAARRSREVRRPAARRRDRRRHQPCSLGSHGRHRPLPEGDHLDSESRSTPITPQTPGSRVESTEASTRTT